MWSVTNFSFFRPNDTSRKPTSFFGSSIKAIAIILEFVISFASELQAVSFDLVLWRVVIWELEDVGHSSVCLQVIYDQLVSIFYL